MSFGLHTWSAAGVSELNENSFTFRIVLSALVTFQGGKTNQDFSVTGCNASNSVAIIIQEGLYDASRVLQFETEMLTDVARVYNYTRTFEASKIASGTQRLLVVRFA